MDWSNYDYGLFKKYRENCSDNHIDSKIQSRDLIGKTNNFINDYEIKLDEFILEKSLCKNSDNHKHKGDLKLNFENYYEDFSSNEVPDFTESKFSDAGTQIDLSSEKQSPKDNGFNAKNNEDLISNKQSNKQTEFSSSPFIGNQTSTNNHSHLDDSKSHSSHCASDSIKKSILNSNNKMTEENDNNKYNFENMSMQNNNFTEYQEEENNLINFKNNCNIQLSIKDLHPFPTQQITHDKICTANRMTANNLILTNQNYILVNNDNISLSEKMKAKIQRAKDLLEKRQYKVIENTNLNENCFRDGKKFQYNLESAYEFSELKINNLSKKNDCPDCINIMSRMNFINKYQNNCNEKITNIASKAQKNLMNKEACHKNIKNQNIKLYSSSDMICLNRESANRMKNSSDVENSAALVENIEFNNNENSNCNNHVVESQSSNGISKNSCLDISLNEEAFTGIGIRNNLNKKELKMLRNRISAQKSRDRKKKEMDDLKSITQELFNQNLLLKKQLEEKDNQISNIKEIFNVLCNDCKAIVAYNKHKNQNINSNFLVEDLNNKQYLYSNGSEKHFNNKNCLDFDKSINSLKNNLINNKRNRVSDFSSIVNNGNRRVFNNLKCGIMTGFLVMACIIGSFAFNYSFNYMEQKTEISNKDIDYKSRILQENITNDFIEIGKSSLKFYEDLKNESLSKDSNQTIKHNNIQPSIFDNYNNEKSLVIYKQKHSSEYFNFENLKELSMNKNNEYLKNFRDKINLHYYLNLSKQIIDKVDKNIYDLTYLTDLSQDTKNTIAQNVIENINKIKHFFELKISQYAYDNYENIKSRDFAFLGKKRLNFIKRNNLENKSEAKTEKFLKYSEWHNKEECLEQKGVRYTISDYNFEDKTELVSNPLIEKSFEDIKHDDNLQNGKIKGNSEKYFNKTSFHLNINNTKEFEIIEAITKNLIVKSNANVNNKINNKIIDMLYFISSNDEKVNSFYCNDFMSTTKENTEFFRRVFDKLDLQKQEDAIKGKKNYSENIFKNNDESKEEKVEFEKKNEDDCLYLHMILPEQNFHKDQVTPDPKDYKNSNSSTFNSKNNTNKRESSNNKKVFYEVGCKIFEINKIYK